MKLMNSSVNALKDANPKIVFAAFVCLDLLIKNFREDFQPLVNMSFEALLSKLADNRVNIILIVIDCADLKFSSYHSYTLGTNKNSSYGHNIIYDKNYKPNDWIRAFNCNKTMLLLL